MTAMKPIRKVRCAIYTRKSSEEGLEMEFNSLDAQREACEAYAASQKAEGWVPVPDRYDDGGFSGGNLERPALKRLLADIEAGLVDVVVVYKIDRLSRSLMDFAKLVEVFDRNSVTQDGKHREGSPFTKNFLYKLLDNRVYLGEAVHKGEAHPGEHPPIIDRAIWDKVQAIKADNAPRKRANAARAKTPAPLKGLVVCAHCGRAMTPSSTRKKGRLYRYYTCMKAITAGHTACPVRSIAAGELEAAVIGQVRALLQAPEIRARAERHARGMARAHLHAALDRFEALWDELFPTEQARILQLLVEQVRIAPDGAEVRLRAEGLASVIADVTGRPAGRSAA